MTGAGDTPPSDARPSRSTLLHSLSWIAAQSWVAQMVRFGTLALLARWLAPADFGRFAFAAAAITLLQPLVGQGIGAALMLVPRLRPVHVTSALVMAAASGCVAIPAYLVLGWLLLAVQGRGGGDLIVFAAMAPSLVLSALATVAGAVSRRAQAFRRLAIMTIGSEMLASVAALVLAIGGDGVWSLVARQVIGGTASCGITLFAIRGLFGARPRRATIACLSRIGRPVAAGQALVAIRERLDEVIVGALFGAGPLGFYSLARRCIEALSALLPAVVMNRAWPVLSGCRHDPMAFRAELLLSLRFVAELGWPIFGLVGVLAPLWVPEVLGPDWLPAVPLVMALALGAAIRSVVGLHLIAMIAMGHARRRLMLEVAATLATYAALAATATAGLVVATWVMALAIVAIAPLELVVIRQALPVTARAQWRIFGRAAGMTGAASLAGGVLMWLARPALPPLVVAAGAFTLLFVVQALHFRRLLRSGEAIRSAAYGSGAA